MFTDALELTLKLTISDQAVSIPGGNVKLWDLDLHSWGFRGRAVFMVSQEKETDALFSSFTAHDLITIDLQIKPHYIPQGTTMEPLTVKGLVTRKAVLVEQTIERGPLEGNPILYRVYEVEFADPAQVVWRGHRPYDLLVDKSVKDLFEAHKNAQVTLTYDWEALDTVHPVLSLCLGMEGGGASFYDFVMWYVFTRNGVWTYDSTANSYALSGAKSSEGTAVALDRLVVDSVRIEFPETPRHKVCVLNGYTENPQQQDIANENAVEGVRCDTLGRYPVAADFDARKTLETARLKMRDHELLVRFRQYPLMTYGTGLLIKLAGGLWGDKLFTQGKTYRVRSIHLRAEAVDKEPTADHNLSFTRYDVDMSSRLETQGETWVELPDFLPPRYPFHVEGKILSEQGDEDAETYQVYEDSETSTQQYKVKIPLWENKVVVAPFMPFIHSGHFYFPSYKNARVLVALDFQEANIVGCLDWRSEARLPADTQGNRILMGQTSTSRTAVSHTYVNNLPVFAMERLADKDTESITFSDGTLVIQTMEKKDGE